MFCRFQGEAQFFFDHDFEKAVIICHQHIKNVFKELPFKSLGLVKNPEFVSFLLPVVFYFPTFLFKNPVEPFKPEPSKPGASSRFP